MPILHLDYETRSLADLRKVGGDVYADDPSTEIMCAAFAVDDGPVQIWKPLEGEPPPAQLVDHIAAGGEVWAHNAPFEMLITNGPGRRQWGLPELRPEQVMCTMAMAYAMGLPGSLDGCAAALGITDGKDMAGSRLMIQMSKPRGFDESGKPIWWERPDQLERLYTYCIQDVVVERNAGHRMPRLSAYERRVWAMDYRINRRGITVDIPAVEAAIKLVESEKERLNAEIRDITDGRVASANAVGQIKAFLEFYGIAAESLDKAAVRAFLADPGTDPVARRVLEIRAEAGKAATAKLVPMVESASADGRVRGSYQYSGAGTRRWTGRRIQLQNLKRPALKFGVIEALIEEIRRGATAEEIGLCFGNPMNVLGDCIRSFLTAAPGHELLVADFSAIEARVLAWLAGQASTLEVFRAGQDVYKAEARNIFGVPIPQITDDQRQVGKVAILGLGFGGGVGAFQTMARGYGVRMEPAYDFLWAKADPEQRVKAQEMYRLYQAKRQKGLIEEDEISEKEFLASDLTKIFWRAANPAVVAYWSILENLAIRATFSPGVQYQTPEGLPPVKFKRLGSFLWCQLPGGGPLCYPYPEVRKSKTPWGSEKETLTYMAEDLGRKWTRFTTYGGSLAENITQAVARDLLADSMLRLEAAGFPVVLHTHDEAGCELPQGVRPLSDMVAIMTTNPPWAEGLPLAAAGFVSKRYRK